MLRGIGSDLDLDLVLVRAVQLLILMSDEEQGETN